MKKLQLNVLIVFLFLSTSLIVQAQDKFENVSVNFTVKYSEADYKNMQQKVTKNGISTRDFGGWLASNGLFGMEVTGKTDANGDSNLTVLIINSQGNILGEQIIAVNSSRSITQINQVTNRMEFISSIVR